MTNALNPKASLFFLSVLPQFIDHDSSRVREQILLLGALDVAVGMGRRKPWGQGVSISAQVLPAAWSAGICSIWPKKASRGRVAF